MEADWDWACEAIPYRIMYIKWKWKDKFDTVPADFLCDVITDIFTAGVEDDPRVKPFLNIALSHYKHKKG